MITTDEAKNIIDYKLGIDPKKILVFSQAGSHLYGIESTDESDEDYIGIYMPTKEQVLLNSTPRQASYKDDDRKLDIKVWSIYEFMRLAYAGETLAIDLLHGNYTNWLIHKSFWKEHLVDNRHEFYTKKMKAFVSYARKQAAKYGLKGERMETLEKVMTFLKSMNSESKLALYWDSLPKGRHIHFINSKPYRMYQVCGKRLLESVRVSYAIAQYERDLKAYGERAKAAKENKGVDWKAVSHALRSAWQVWNIFERGTYEYPLPNSQFLSDVKLGRLDFITVVQPELEKAMDKIEELAAKSDLPENVDTIMWNKWLMNTIELQVLTQWSY